MEQIIKDRLLILEKRYERSLKLSKTEHIDESTKDFYEIRAEMFKEQIILLQEILASAGILVTKFGL